MSPALLSFMSFAISVVTLFSKYLPSARQPEYSPELSCINSCRLRDGNQFEGALDHRQQREENVRFVSVGPFVGDLSYLQ